MADMHFERTLKTRQFCGPLADQMSRHGRNWLAWTRDSMFPQPAAGIDDFGDSRVFFVHDGSRCGETGLAYAQGNAGPTIVYIDEGVPDFALASMADRHGLVFDELLQFRDQWERDIIFATPTAETRQ